MKLTNYLFLFLLITLTSCDNAKQEEARLQKEVIDTHDTLMVQMDNIMSQKSKLDSLTASFKKLVVKQPTTDTIALKSDIINLKAELTKADDAMMQWMHQFNPDYTGKSHEEIMVYLNDQKVKIDAVKTLFEQSLSKSESFISKF